MRTKRFVFTIIPLALCALLNACSAEDGADGATGPQGEQGLPGADGQNGQDGTANVFSSGWFEIDTWDTDLADFKFHRIPNLNLTEFQIENDLILVYRRYRPTPTLTQVAILPVAVNSASGDLELSLTNRVQGNGLFIQIQAFGRNVAGNEYLPPETQFRYIIIEPDPTSDKNNTPNFFKMSYEEVIAYLGLHP